MKTFAVQVLLLTLFIALSEGGRSRSPCARLSRPPTGRRYPHPANSNRPAPAYTQPYRTPDNLRNPWRPAGAPFRHPDIHREGWGGRPPWAHLSRPPTEGSYTQPANNNGQSPACDDTQPYRTLDGSCNNLKNPQWGTAGAPFSRVLPPVYADGIGNPRTLATSGSTLPHPRAISNHVHFELSFLSTKNTVMLMQWGHFIDHDFTETPVMTDNGGDIDCCTWPDSVQNNTDSPCIPIYIPNGDPYFPDGKCMNFVRSEAASGTGTSKTNPRQQYNGLTAFIDGSLIYGVSTAQADELRYKTPGAGLMKVSNGNLLPKADGDDCFLNTSDSSNYCFKAGDSRVNVFPGLSLLHTLFVREHNRIARVLKTAHPLWQDERLFQEARKIVSAELQVITFGEWLPEILGQDGISTYGLGFDNYNYDETLDPTIGNVFSTAAFRFGHSMVPEALTIGSEVVDTGDLFKRTKYLINNLNDVVGSFVEAPAERVDAWYVDGMRDRMFERDSAAKDGFDIVSLSVQREREHGLPSYNEWREHCGLPKITSFTNGTEFGRLAGQDLADIYESVDDIDLYSGGVSELPNTPAAVGKTYMCLIGEQFRKLRDGDRFWFESTNTVTGFTDSQIKELKKASLSRIICDNADNLQSIQPSAFVLIDTSTNTTGGNKIQPCSTLEEINIRMFW
ncbi:salivary peroxidase/catechol oxidase-like [Haliotis cracherodii]|uniref:salivary peroxidase/catechol oxidase-like n=1 Tax=Haliotis cracherodii TaxID=6455 RepID=UPI0039E8BAFC